MIGTILAPLTSLAVNSTKSVTPLAIKITLAVHERPESKGQRVEEYGQFVIQSWGI